MKHFATSLARRLSLGARRGLRAVVNVNDKFNGVSL